MICGNDILFIFTLFDVPWGVTISKVFDEYLISVYHSPIFLMQLYLFPDFYVWENIFLRDWEFCARENVFNWIWTPIIRICVFAQ